MPVIAREDCKLIGMPRILLEEIGVFTQLQRTPVQSADGKARNIRARLEALRKGSERLSKVRVILSTGNEA